MSLTAGAFGTGGNATNNTLNLTFFSDHLTAFELWLDYGIAEGESPTYLPILLQVCAAAFIVQSL